MMASKSPDVVLPASILDTDLYKFTMQQAILHHFPDARAKYRFKNRDKDKGRYFTKTCYERFKSSVTHFADIFASDSELEWLHKACPYFTQDYLNYLRSYRFKPGQVKTTFVPVADSAEYGDIEIEAEGLWVETILWEVPLMATLSENWFLMVDTDWSYDGQAELAYEKGTKLLQAGCTFSEFGTRRRRSFKAHDIVMDGLMRASKDYSGSAKLSGTSNVYLAMKYGVNPVGTIAHEWFMGVAALKGYENCNGLALDLWEQVYPGSLLIALTDTFSTEAFYKDFVKDTARARRWKAIRQDSGDPYVYAPRAKEIYTSLGIDYKEKMIVFSDALNMDKALGLKKQCDELGFPCSFGIGTWLTNDFKKASSGGKEKSPALNMVIKLSEVNDKLCVKISDEIMKNTGEPSEVRKAKETFGL
ncbi:nicotinate phosphoribosyltransferase, partial [Neolentinus lepideus HHB14362 ss-1]